MRRSYFGRAAALGVAMALGVAVAVAAGTSAPPVRFQRGMTAEQQLARRADLHRWLLDEVPAAALRAAREVRLTPQERADLEQPAPGPGPLRVGVVRSLDPGMTLDGMAATRSRLGEPAAGGVLRATDDGGFVWAMAVASPEAGGIRLHFSGFRLPPGADLYLLGGDGEAYGPYQRRGPHGDGEFWADTVLAPVAAVVVRHFGPATEADRRSIGFRIDEIGLVREGFVRPRAVPEGHASGFCGNETCIENAACHSVAAVADAEDAVAQMLWVSGAFLYTCTGGLLADTAGSQIPYFLTANHCMSKGRDAQNLEAYFFYRASSCNSSCPSNSGFPKTVGATILSTNRTGDYTLLQLSQNPPSGSVMMGWNSAPVAFTNGAALHRISHPDFGAQTYSEHQVDTSKPTCTSWPRGSWIYSEDVVGATDGGSSGSPVVNGSGEVVGQLSGGCGFNVGDVCDAASNATVDGALASYFSAVEPYLDPAGCTPSAEVCNDGTDNDCDGAVDCADADCAGDPACAGGCSLGQLGDSCSSDAECCSSKCKGPPGGKTCR